MNYSVYTRFASLLQTGIYSSFESICRALRVCPDDLDELIYSELGCTGRELVDYFGNQQEIH